MTNHYPVLEGEIAKRGVMKRAIAKALCISDGSLSNKLAGRTSFSWEEACVLQERFFPDISQELLFSRTA